MTTPQPTGLRKFLKYDTLDLSRVVSSNIVDARTLLIIRAIVALHLVAVFIATLYVSARDEVFYMVPTTFTNLSNIGLTAYYLVTILATIMPTSDCSGTHFNQFELIKSEQNQNAKTPHPYYTLSIQPLDQ